MIYSYKKDGLSQERAPVQTNKITRSRPPSYICTMPCGLVTDVLEERSEKGGLHSARDKRSRLHGADVCAQAFRQSSLLKC